MPDQDPIPAETDPAVEAAAEPDSAVAAAATTEPDPAVGVAVTAEPEPAVEAAAAEPEAEPAVEVAAPAEPDPAAETATPAAAAAADLSPAACAARLAELFPALFGAGPPKPLKLRIQADIQQRAPGVFSRKSLSGFLHRYTTTTAYLIALSKAAQRIDLDGAPAGDVNDEHREAANAELARRRGIHEARRAAENAARREADAQARQQHAAEADARRDRAALLRAFETTTLTPANFCALKRLDQAQLDATLAVARQERAQRPPDVRPDLRPDLRGDARGDARGERRPEQRPPNERGGRPDRADGRPDGRPGFDRKSRPRPPARPASR